MEHKQTQTCSHEDLREEIQGVVTELEKVKSHWWKISLTVLIPFLLAVYGYGVLNNEVANLKETIQTKANKETVENQLSSIGVSLDNINRKLDSLTVIKTK